MRKPNGWGSVYKLGGRRRNPWAARKTTGYNEKGQPVYMFVGYYQTRAEAERALAVYNAKPYDARASLGSVLEAWKAEAFPELRPGSRYQYEYACGLLAPLSDRKIGTLRLADMQALVSSVPKSAGSKIKAVLGLAFSYAVRQEILSADRRELVRFLKLSDEGRTVERRVFSSDEIASIDDPRVLILLYTGLRVGEFCALNAEDIHLAERWLYVREAKTAAGVRVVPIAEKIAPYFEGLRLHESYSTIKRAVAVYGGHRPHDTRHTFISLCADRGIDERLIRAIVGHSGSGITETVYTHLDLAALQNAVNLL